MLVLIKLNQAKDIAKGFNARAVKILPSMDLGQKFMIDYINKSINSQNIVYGNVAVGDIDKSINVYKWTFHILDGYFLMDEMQIGISQTRDDINDNDKICYGFSSFGMALGTFGTYTKCKSFKRKRWNVNDTLKMTLNISEKWLSLSVNDILMIVIAGIEMKLHDKYHLAIMMSNVDHKIQLIDFEAFDSISI